MVIHRTQRLKKGVEILLLGLAFLLFPLGAHSATIWSTSDTPNLAAVSDGQQIEVGVKFQSDSAGYITGVRFYKGAANTGTHVGNLWNRTGTLLASATFTNETSSGWQEVRFATPVAITAGTTYIASYHSSGYFALSESYFVAAKYTPPLRALANGQDGGNGVFKYGASGFPTLTWNANNYWVDVVFTANTTGDTTPPQVTSFVVPASSSTLTVPITAFTATDDTGVTGYLVNESATPPAATASGWSATAPTSYAFASSGSKNLYAWAKDAAGNVSASMSATVTITASVSTVEPAGWYAGDMHTHRSCGGSPLDMNTMLNNMAPQNLKAISLLADAGNGEVQDPTIDLPKVNGQDDAVSTADRTIHWDAEWHWDANYFQYPHQALGGHVLALGLTEAHQIWQEYTYPVLQWARQQGGIAGFAHMQSLDNSIPQDLNCCKPIEYPVEVALGAADFISEDVEGGDSFINAYYRLLNTGFRPGFAAGSDFPCGADVGSSLTYVKTSDGQFSYRKWLDGIAQGRTVISRNGHNEFLALTVNGNAGPGDQIDLSAAGNVPVTIQWTANQSLSGTVELVQNGVVVASSQKSVAQGSPASLSTTVNFTKSGWLAARRMGANGHVVHTAAVYVLVGSAPIRTSASDAQFYVQWMDNLLTKTSPGGVWNSYFPTSLAAAQARYQQAKEVFQQRAAEAGGGDTGTYSIWSGAIPGQAAVNDGKPIEVGVKFQADVAGYITALRFYKGAANTGTHVGHLWSRTGTLLATATFSGETASGWQEVKLPSPVAIAAGTTYVASYYSSSGYFALDEGYFTSGDYTPPLRALANGVDGGNGVYYFGASGFPTQTWNSNNYWVDVVFTTSGTSDTTAPTVTAFTVPATSTTLTVPITAFTATDNVGVTGYLVTESSSAPSSSATGWSSTAPASYTVSSTGSKTLYAWAKDAAGNVSSAVTATVSVSGGDTTKYSIWSTGSSPSKAAVSDGQPIEVGVKFQADVTGYITALRFYKGTANTGTHIGHLWSRTGTLLATATFSGETASGWQEVQLASPVAITAGTTYVASYYSSSGYFALNEGYFSSSVYNAPLRALANGTDGGNGVYYFGASGFPTQTWNSNNYWVDVVFTSGTPATDTTAPTVTAFTVPSTSTSLSVPITTLTATDNVGVTGYLVNESSTKPAADASGWSATAPTSYTVTGTGSKTLYAWAKDAAGNVSASLSATVTVSTSQSSYSIWPASATPAKAAVSDGAAIEVGVKFQADVAGYITALRFYKGAANTGTHTGHLWSRTGTLLATATFSGETSSGWQQVQLSTPVAITAGTTYIASYYSSSGYFALSDGYFTSSVYNAPLRALANGADGGNGVYNYGSSAFPTATWNGNCYWVDVVFTASSDPTPPTVTAFTVPSTSSSLIVPITAFTATDNVGVAGYLVTESSTAPGTSASGWSATAPTAYAVATAGSKTLYAWAKDAAGNVSASRSAGVTVSLTDTTPPTVTSFTLPATSSSLTVPITAFTATDNVGVTGYLVTESSTTPSPIASGWSATAPSAYSVASTGTKTLYAWAKDAAGNVSASMSATVTVGGTETDTIAPTITSFTVPATSASLSVSITAFTATDNVGVTGYLVNEVASTPSPSDSGWSATAPTSYTFATSGNKVLYAWAKDAAGNISTALSAAVTVTGMGTGPAVNITLPLNIAPAVSTGTTVSAIFNKPMTISSINSTTFQLLDSTNSPIAATVTYDGEKYAAVLTPSSILGTASTYTAVIKGGASGVKDSEGTPLAADYSWSFTSGASSPFDNGPGGPILIITATSNPFSRYLTEVLLAEGFNDFTVKDISTVTATILAEYEVAILGAISISSSQASMLNDWVTGGGNLIAMRPDKQLAGLLGLADTGTTLDEGYLLVNTASEPGAGIVGQTMQYHGTADRYTLAGATSIANLYADSTTATANPAVTLRFVGSNGGQAAAFTFDLARSIVYTRQGNPDWADQDRDGQPPVRPNDLFYPDWINLNKVAIPQADEQQRLLANMIISMNADRKPLPRFWYFPNDNEAVIVMTGDDHDGLYGTYGTTGRFNWEIANSPGGCSVENWTCLRSSSYLISDYPAGFITNEQALAYNAQGFELGIHMNTYCENYSASTIASYFQNQLGQWHGLFPSLPPPVSHRQHCVAWSGYTMLPEEEVKHGIRLDTNYYYWPADWASAPGFFTGSGMPMRFANKNGAIIDVYQATTQMTDESGQIYPATLNTLLDRATGSEKYYGVFTTNMHTDEATTPDYISIISSAQARGVPVVSGKQMLKWIDGRNGSKFGGLSWSGNVLGFTVSRAAGATGLQAMIPLPSGHQVTSVTYNGSPLPFSLKTIKGVTYAVFAAQSGTYTVTMP